MNYFLVARALGGLLAVIGLCMAAALPWSFYYGDGVHDEIIAVVLGSLLAGGVCYRIFRGRDAEYGIREGFAIVTLGWLMAGLVGALPYLLTGILPSFVDALFESISGFTTTGATVIEDVESIPRSILFWRSLTHWLGGMGIIVLSVAILPLLGVGGMAMFKAEVPSPVMDKLKPTVAETAKTLWKVYLLFTVVEIVLLYLAGMDLFDSMCSTFGTLATGGFSTKNQSIAAYESNLVNIIITVFMLIAGVNFTLHYQALTRKPRAYLESTEFRLYMLVFVAASLFIGLNLYGTAYESAVDTAVQSVFQTAAIMTTTGYVTANWEQWPWGCQWILFLLMFMGGCAGSTGGGIKCLRIIIIAKHVFRELELLIHPRAVMPLKIDRKVVHAPIINSILAFMGLFTGIWALSTFLLVALDIDPLTALGATTATLCNIGPGLNQVGAMDTYAWLSSPAKWLLIFNMVAGRLELYPVFVLMVPDFWSD